MRLRGVEIRVYRHGREVMSEQVYIYRWNRMGRKGQRCVVLVRGTRNSCLLQFEDGYKAVTSRNALRKA